MAGGRAMKRGRGQEPREGAVPPCRPPAVRATRYHWPVMCVSLSRSHWYRSECLVTALPPLPSTEQCVSSIHGVRPEV